MKDNSSNQSKANLKTPQNWENVSSVEFNQKTLEQPEYQNLLKAIHSGLYSKTFPIIEEQEDVEDWIKRSQETGRNPQQLINAHFKDDQGKPGSGLEEALKLAGEIVASKEGSKERNVLQKQFDDLTVFYCW